MFTNKNKTIGLIALIVVIVMVVSVGLSVLLNNGTKALAEKTANDVAALNGKIDALTSALEKLQNGQLTESQVKDIVNGILGESGVNTGDWAEATEKIAETLVTLGKAYAPVNGEPDKDEKEDVRVNYSAAQLKVIDAAYVTAGRDINRAHSVKALEDAVKSFNDTLAAAPTIDAEIATVLAKVDVKNITYPADAENIELLRGLQVEAVATTGDVNKAIYTAEGEAKTLDAQITAILDASVAEAKEWNKGEFIAEITALPSAEEVTLASAEALEAALKHGEACNFTQEEIDNAKKTLKNALTKAAALATRVATLEAAEEAAEALNKTLAIDFKALAEDKAFVEANGKTIAVKAGWDTLIAAKEAIVAGFYTTYGIVTPAQAEEDEDLVFVQANYDLIDHAVVEGYRATYNTSLDALKELYITLCDAYAAFNGLGEDEEGNEVDVTFDEYKAAVEAMRAAIKAVKAHGGDYAYAITGNSDLGEEYENYVALATVETLTTVEEVNVYAISLVANEIAGLGEDVKDDKGNVTYTGTSCETQANKAAHVAYITGLYNALGDLKAYVDTDARTTYLRAMALENLNTVHANAIADGATAADAMAKQAALAYINGEITDLDEYEAKTTTTELAKFYN